MIVKLRKRYYCEYCKKAGGSSFHMKRHEDGCTLNPNRVCGMCKIGELKQSPLSEMFEALDEDDRRFAERNTDDLTDFDPIEPNLLRLKANGCPACMLAAIRQSPGNHYVKFDFRDESKSFFEPVNIAREQERAIDWSLWREHNAAISAGLCK